jgi:integral membrane protein (TIGR01906 family)
VKIIQVIAQWLFILCLPVLLLTASVSLAANCPWLYTYGFDKYDVGETTGLEEAELDKVADGLRAYFNSGEEYISLNVLKDGESFEVFNEREVGHLKDVKGLFRLVYVLLLGTGIYAVVYVGVCLFWWRDRRLYMGLLGGGGLTLALMLALGLAAAINFDWLFLNFHLLSFANDLWMLDPSTDYLIMLFPRGFWFDAAYFCAGGTAFLAIVLGGVGWWRLRKERSQTD